MKYSFQRFLVRPFSFVCSAIILFSSCATLTKPTSYFRDVTADSMTVALSVSENPVLMVPGDQLSISISSLNKEEDNIFNGAALPIQLSGDRANFPGYTVDKEGFILVHKLGKVKAAGLTRQQLKENLQKELLPFLKDPIVGVQFLNHKVTLMGEVVTPKIISITEDRMALTDVLTTGGDLTINGRRDLVMVIRETDGKKMVKRLSLEEVSVFSSPWYWVKNNDIVYVSPDDDRRYRDERRNRFSMFFTMTISALSLLIIILDRVLQ